MTVPHHTHKDLDGREFLTEAVIANNAIYVWDSTNNRFRPLTTLAGLTLTAPTIADFTNANHDHGDTDDGGVLVVGALPEHDNTAHTDRTRTVWIPASQWNLDGATRVTRGTLPNGYDAIQLDNAVTEGAYILFQMPEDATANQTPSFLLYFTGDGSAAADVRVQTNILTVNPLGGDLVAAGTTEAATFEISGTADAGDFPLTAFNGGTASQGHFVRVHVSRVGGDAADTYTGAVFFLGAELDYTGDM